MREVDAIFNQRSGVIKEPPAAYERGIGSGAFNALTKGQRDILLYHYEVRMGFVNMSKKFHRSVGALWMSEHKALSHLARLNAERYPLGDSDFMIGLEEGGELDLNEASQSYS